MMFELLCKNGASPFFLPELTDFSSENHCDRIVIEQNRNGWNRQEGIGMLFNQKTLYFQRIAGNRINYRRLEKSYFLD